MAEPLHSSPIEPPGLNRFHLCDITGINPHIPWRLSASDFSGHHKVKQTVLIAVPDSRKRDSNICIISRKAEEIAKTCEPESVCNPIPIQPGSWVPPSAECAKKKGTCMCVCVQSEGKGHGLILSRLSPRIPSESLSKLQQSLRIICTESVAFLILWHFRYIAAITLGFTLYSLKLMPNVFLDNALCFSNVSSICLRKNMGETKQQCI